MARMSIDKAQTEYAANRITAEQYKQYTGVEPRYRKCERCGFPPWRHNPLNDAFIGHEYE